MPLLMCRSRRYQVSQVDAISGAQGVLRISSDRDDGRIFFGLKIFDFEIFFGYLD